MLVIPMIAMDGREVGARAGRGSTLAPLVAAGLLALSCRPAPARPPHEALALRLIAEAPSDRLETALSGDPVPVASWSLGDPAGRRAWTCDACDPLASSAGFRVRSSVAAPSLTREVDLPAESVDAVEASVAAPRRGWRTRGQLRLFWADGSAGFAVERSVAVDAVQEPGAYAATYTFLLSGRPGWTGRIRRLRLQPTSVPGETVDVLSVRAVKYRRPMESLTGDGRRPWRVELQNEVRSALPLDAAHPLSMDVSIPTGARLVFGYATSGALPARVAFTLSARTASATRVLWTDTVGPAAGSGPAWRDASVDLGALGGHRADLRLEAREAASSTPVRAVAVVSNPELWARAEGPAPLSVLLVSIDTLRADRMSLYGNRRPTSPGIDRWALRRGVVFDDAVAPAPWTLPSHTSLFTGLDPLRHGVNYENAAPAGLWTLARAFRAGGYETAAVTGGGFLAPAYGLDQGFDRFAYWPRDVRGTGSDLGHGVDDALAWLRSVAGRPFFFFLHTYEVHAPYRAKQPYYGRLTGNRRPPDAAFVTQERLPPPGQGGPVEFGFVRQDTRSGQSAPAAAADLSTVVDFYDSAVASADAQVDRLLTAMDRMGLLDRTLVVITSDHGEALGERGGLADHAYLFDFNLRIPLILLPAGGRGGGRRIGSQVALVDVMPTLLDLAGLPAAPDVDGRSLRGLLEGRPEPGPRVAWSYAPAHDAGLALRVSGKTKYILSNTAFWPNNGREQLYDLMADPAESHDLAGDPARAASLRDQALRELATSWSGLGVTFTNRTAKPIVGRLSASFLHEARVKATPLAWPAVRWRQSGEIELDLRPRSSFELMLEGATAGPLAFRLGDAGEHRIVVSDGSPPQGLVLRGGRWQAGSPGAAPFDAAILVRWRGQGRAAGESPADADPRVREALKALGYVH